MSILVAAYIERSCRKCRSSSVAYTVIIVNTTASVESVVQSGRRTADFSRTVRLEFHTPDISCRRGLSHSFPAASWKRMANWDDYSLYIFADVSSHPVATNACRQKFKPR